MPGATDQTYKARLAEILRRRDPAELHVFLRQSAAGYGDERQIVAIEERSHAEMEELMHRMILARSDLADLHAASRAWLIEHDPAGLAGSSRGAGNNRAGSSGPRDRQRPPRSRRRPRGPESV